MHFSKKNGVVLAFFGLILLVSAPVWAAYHHEGEHDAERFLTVHPEKRGTKLDHCALCHSGGEYINNKGKPVSLSSCQWCHYHYGYDGNAGGTLQETLNSYGLAYDQAGQSVGAITAIENQDSDLDGASNKDEIAANSFPGNAADFPGKKVAPYRVYTREQLAAMPQHTQFMLMNTSKSGDFYAQYSGVPMADLLADAGMLDPTATEITVYAPDGWSQDHPVNPVEDGELYHVKGAYPQATFQYDVQADEALNPQTGWCDYSAPSAVGYNHGDPIVVNGGPKLILAMYREGRPMDAGVLNQDNKLDGEGPYRVVPPQKGVNPPDQSSRVDNWAGIWPYNHDWDHNAGAATRSTTIIKVGPLPAGTTDIDVMEAGWGYIDRGMIVIYGAIDDTDSNENGVYDSEERAGGEGDSNGDGVPDYKDPKTARLRHANGLGKLVINASKGHLKEVKSLKSNDPAIPETGRPSGMATPFGTLWYNIAGLDANDPDGESVVVTITLPENLPTNAKLFKIHPVDGWKEIPFESNDGDNVIRVVLRDGDPLTDADGVKNGIIVDPIAPVVPAIETTSGGGSSSDSGSSSCFIKSMLKGLPFMGK